MMENFERILQLFAEATEGDTAHFTGENEAAAAPQATGEETASAAGVQDRSSAFEALIKGEFKAEYDARVRDTVQKRLRSQKAQTQALEALTPALTKLAKSRGVDPGDIPGLTRLLEAAGEPETRDPEALAAQAEQLKAIYEDFDLTRELENPRFAQLLQARVDLQTAYEVVHNREHFSQALAEATAQLEKALATKLAAAQNRPAENGIGPGSAAVIRNDVSQMTRQDRTDIINRVRRGETIRF